MNEIKNDILSELLVSFESNIDRIKYAGNEDDKRTEFLKVCKEVLDKKDQKTASNLQNLINYYLFTLNVEVEQFITSISNEKVVLESFDYYTEEREKKDSFDATYDTITDVIVEQFEMEELISPDRYINSARYHPSPVNSVKLALNSLVKYGVTYSDFVFIDIGSGMGRNLLIASEYPFKRVAGVEISNYLHEIAEKNVARYEAKTGKKIKCDLHCVDALSFNFSESNMVLYFWEPFTENISNQFIKNLEEFIATRNIIVKLIFLRNPFPAMERSTVFKEVGRLESEDYTISNDEYFQTIIYSN
ncbi:class I SAM-dependent methyltransferase [uncultured Kordia sp.]|uniref:class I SAM-dependent methyltransferase n=1 Tax=uncultured Kordia sp. TaxID=507699 RepID=UPI002601E822|nr:class I SAM-dependent methyltransferase [uncultured Kordia sp.]